jgi:signal transduction histidine kinase
VGVKHEKEEKREEELTRDEEKREEDNPLGGIMSNIHHSTTETCRLICLIYHPLHLFRISCNYFHINYNLDPYEYYLSQTMFRNNTDLWI